MELKVIMHQVIRPRKLVLGMVLVLSAGSVSLAQSWKFGVMDDTQWSRGDGRNPGACAVDTANGSTL
jgi:hypothetical protein